MNYPPDDPYKRQRKLNDYVKDMMWEFDRTQQRFPEPESVQLRGCGNPDCYQCNPEVADQRRRDGTAGSGSGNYARPSAPEPDDDLREAVEAYIITAPEQTFTDIVGNEAALTSLRDAIEAPSLYADLYAAYGMKMPKGAVLHGPPGCGKTMFARAAASEMNRLYGMKEFISISGGELQTMFVGATEAKIKAIFAYAREYAHLNGHPLLVFIDEAEVLFPDRTGRVRRPAPWEESQVATFLAEMDGMQECGAFVLLATNRIEVMDQALLRDGRCDFKVRVARPTQEAIEQIVRNTFAKTLNKDSVDDLVFAAVESFFDPHKVIVDFHQIVEEMKDWLEAQGVNIDKARAHFNVLGARNFALEHIVSGAMAASVAARATRKAFARDKLDGTARGIIVDDVVASVNDLFEENKGLTHQFAQQEFQEQLVADLKGVK